MERILNMKRTSAELKRISRENLIGHWGLAIGADLLVGLIVSAVLMPFYFLLLISGQGTVQIITYLIAVLIISLLAVIMQCGITRMYLGFARKQETGIGMLFGEFTRRPDRYILGCLMLLGLEFICILPGAICWVVGMTAGVVLASVIGGVLYIVGVVALLILSLRYSLVFILLVDHAELGVLEAFRESARLMAGNKGRLFYICLSFIGWSILGMLSCGLGMLWVSPYMTQTNINFYRDVTGELDRLEKTDGLDGLNGMEQPYDGEPETEPEQENDYVKQ